METIFRSAAIAALVIAASCGKDKVEAIVEELDEQTEQLEQTLLEANDVSDNLVISGGTEMEGMPPAPNGTLSFDVSGTSKSAFLGEGFDVSLNTDSQIVGAYIQIKAEDGTSADSYYDVNIDANASDNKSSKKINRRSSKAVLAQKENDISLDVDFTNEIEPGIFCYEICVYDGEGSVSEPQEVCLTVESWGGFTAAVGNWNMTKEEETKEDGSVKTWLLGIEICNDETIECDNGSSLETSECSSVDIESLVINADGTFVYDYKESWKELNQLASEESCEATFWDDSYRYISKGKWAYQSEDNKLIFLEFEYSTEDSEGVTEEVNEPGEAEGVFDTGASISGNSLIATQGYYKIYFEK